MSEQKRDKMEVVMSLVEDLIGDLDNRSGFDTGDIDQETMDEWKATWRVMVWKAMTEVEP